MKSRALKQLVFLLLIIVVFAGCRTGSPVFNVEEATINTVSGKEPALEDVSRAIVSAGGNWNMQIVKPGHIVATLHNRQHMAQVDIQYTTKGYSITRKDSAELQYDAEKGTIHDGYNRWVQRLDSNIRTRLNTL